MKLLLNKRCLVVCFLLTISVGTTVGQNNYYNSNYDSLVSHLDKAHGNLERIELLTLLVDLAQPPAAEPSEKTVLYLTQLVQLNQQVNHIDSKPYEMMLNGYSAWRKGDFRSALADLRKAVNLFDEQKKIIVNLLITMRILFNRLNQQEERYKFYKAKLDYYIINGPVENTGACYHGIAGYYTYKADYNLAISNYLKAASVFKSFYTLYYANEIGAAGVYYSIWGNDEKATYYLEKAILMDRAISYNLNLAYCLNALSKVALRKKKYNDALLYAEESIEVCNKNVVDPTYAIALLQKGFVHLATKQHALAFSYLTKVKNLSDSLYPQITSSQGELEVDYALYKYYQRVNNNQLAGKYLTAAYSKANIEKTYLLQLKYLRELSVFYQRENPVLALQYIGQYFSLDDTLKQQQNRFKVAQFENEEKELAQSQKIYVLRQERAVQEATLSKRNTIIYISIAALFVFCSLLIILYRQYRSNLDTLFTLRKTQNRLIFTEKMASLGELTAGIAHEIQNPLNFVNNLCEVSTELVDELVEEAEAGHTDDVLEIAGDLKQTLEKVNHHGKRADSIVKGMLQHSRSSSGEKQPTDLNKLADEYLRLAYQGLRAKDKSFNADLRLNLDPNLGLVNVAPQEIGRVLLNIYNNAFYATQEKLKQTGKAGIVLDYQPQIEITTHKGNGQVELRIKDNGIGISPGVIGKIYQPFFTTKPAGQGTGLGLSLSYDIVTKGHGGDMRVESTPGEFTEFVVSLPL